MTDESEPRPTPTPRSEIPGPSPTFLVGWRGNAVSFFHNPVAYLCRLRGYGPVVRLAAGGNGPLFARREPGFPGTLFAFGPECNRRLLVDVEVFQTRTPPGPATPTFQRLSTNLLFINGDRHRHLRRLLMPTFMRDNLRGYHGDIVGYARRMLDGWRGRERIDAAEETSDLALQVASQCFYGLDLTTGEEQLAVLMHRMLEQLFSPVTAIPIDLPGSPYRRLKASMERIIEALLEEIENKRAAGEEANDVLSRMVREHDREPTALTLDELIGNAFVMFFAGHDTTSKALAWTLFLLFEHPAVAADLLDELESELGGEPPTFEQAFQLPLLDRVIRESLRVLPPGIMFPRVATAETELAGHRVPAGSEVVYSPYVTHHDPEVFSEPERFRPDRWIDFKPSPYEYLPFGAGIRSCLGSPFASLQLRIVIPMVLQRYRLRLVPGTRIDPAGNLIMAPRKGLPMTVHPQDRAFRSGGGVRGYVRRMVDLD